jgi:hypothetical protein
MTGHWICEYCHYDGEHAEWCRCLRPVEDQWKGPMTDKEVRELKAKRQKQQEDKHARTKL